MRGKKDATTFSRQACFVNRVTLQGFKLKSEAIHETGLSGKCSCVLFSSHNTYIHTYIYIYIYTHTCCCFVKIKALYTPHSISYQGYNITTGGGKTVGMKINLKHV